MVVWKFAGKVELCFVGKNFSFEMRLDILVMMKSSMVNESPIRVLVPVYCGAGSRTCFF